MRFLALLTLPLPLPSRREHISFALRTSPYPRFTLLDYKKKLFFFCPKLSKIIQKFNLFNLVNLRTKNFSLIWGNFGQIDLEPCVVVMQWYRNSISGGGYHHGVRE